MNIKLCSLLVFALTLFCPSCLYSQEFELLSSWWKPNGYVYTTTFDTTSNVVYLGGSFSYIGPPETFGTQVSTTSAQVDFVFPNPNGEVLSSVSDGHGGWFIGGLFTMVGDSLRRNLAHINAAGQVSSKFVTNPCNGAVRTLFFDGINLYAGGDFTRVGDSIRNRIAKFDTSANLVNVGLNHGLDGPVHCMIMRNDTMVIGGDFAGYGQVKRYGALINKTTAKPSSGYAEPNGPVYSATPDGIGGWYIGGAFTQLGDSIRRNIAHLDSTGQITSLFRNRVQMALFTPLKKLMEACIWGAISPLWEISGPSGHCLDHKAINY